MGAPMAKNLLKAGFQVTVHNRTRSKEAELAGAGAVSAASPQEVAQASQVVITMVPDSPDVQQVILGPQGVLEGASPDLIVIE